MPREHYQENLDKLRRSVLGLGDDVVDQLEAGLGALLRGDEPLARDVIEGDDAINERYLVLESDCIDILALQQPVAGDLRFVASSFKILTDLERIGDLAANLGTYALSASRDPDLAIDVETIGADAIGMVEDALDAYEREDVDLCYDVEERDDHLDALCLRASERVVRDLIERRVDEVDPWDAERLVDDVSRLLLTIRDLERVGDHAVNVAAQTLYAVESDPELVY